MKQFPDVYQNFEEYFEDMCKSNLVGEYLPIYVDFNSPESLRALADELEAVQNSGKYVSIEFDEESARYYGQRHATQEELEERLLPGWETQQKRQQKFIDKQKRLLKILETRPDLEYSTKWIGDRRNECNDYTSTNNSDTLRRCEMQTVGWLYEKGTAKLVVD
jgi:hypothetical protein